MPKNIIICSDGTGNAGIKDRGTNVFKLFEAVDLNGHRTDPTKDAQVALYDDGVGTETLLPLKLLGGAFGFGLAHNVRNLYMGLVRIYDPGDKIFLFGFSRGAFTVRTLAGMIGKCGILDRTRLPSTDDLRATVTLAYQVYRRSYRTWLQNLFHGKKGRQRLEDVDKQMMEDFRDEHSISEEVKITFLGVWDTVDAVGGPFHTSDLINAVIHRFKFPDRELNPNVKYACQALSIDDARAAFEPLLWKADPERIEQVWFAGVHSNVGGGYPKQGMSLVTLDWMMQKASVRGLRIWPDDRKYYWEHCSPDDKLYDSRAGLGVFYRWKPRDMQNLWDQQYRETGEPPVVHVSVLERVAHGTDGYAPGTIAAKVKVVYTPSSNPNLVKAQAENDAADVRARVVEGAVNAIPEQRRSLIENVRGTLVTGRVAYYLYVTTCAAVLIGAAIMKGGGLNPWNVLKNAAVLIYSALTGSWGNVWPSAVKITQSPLFLVLMIGFILSGWLASRVDRKRSDAFSRFWHKSRQELRKALKDSHQLAQATSAGAQGGPVSAMPPPR